MYWRSSSQITQCGGAAGLGAYCVPQAVQMKPSISLLPKVEDSHVEELVDLTLAITTINAHNRLAVAFRRVPGS
jgi:hypothetical protein